MKKLLASFAVLAVLASPLSVVLADDLTETIKMLEQTQSRLAKVLEDVKRKGQHLHQEKKGELRTKADVLKTEVESYEKWVDTYLSGE